MKGIFSRVVSLTLAVLMTVSLMSGLTITVSAAGEPEVLLTDDFGQGRTDAITAKMEPSLLVDAAKLKLYDLVSKDLKNTPDEVLCQVLAGTNKDKDNITFGYKLDKAVDDIRITMTGQLAKNGTGPGNGITAVQLSADGVSWTNDLKTGTGLSLSTDPDTMYLDPDYDALKLIEEKYLDGTQKPYNEYTNAKSEAWVEYTLSLSEDGKAAAEKLGGDIKYVRVKFINGGKLWQGAIRKIDILGQPTYTWASDAKVEHSDVTKTEAKLTWPVIDATASGLTYRVTRTGGSGEDVQIVDANAISYTGLTAGTEYSVSIDAMKESSVVSTAALTGAFTTEADAPAEPEVFLTDDFEQGRTDAITAKMEPSLLVDAAKLKLYDLVSKDLKNTPKKVLCQVLAGTNKDKDNITFGYKLDKAVDDIRITMTGQLAKNGTGPGNGITAVQLSADGVSWTNDLKTGTGLSLSTDPDTMYLDPDYDALKLIEEGYLDGTQKPYNEYTNAKSEAWVEYTLSLSEDGKAAAEKLGGDVKYVRVKFINGGKLWQGAIRKIDILGVASTEPEQPTYTWASDAAVTASDETKTGATVSWPSISGEVTGYRVTRTGGSGGEDVQDVQDTTLTYSGLEPGVIYTVTVEALADGKVASDKLEGTFTTVAQQLYDWPAGAQVMASELTQTSAKLDWTAIPDVEGISYHVKVTGGGGTVEKDVTGTSLALSDLTPDTNYTVEVTAVLDGVTVSKAPLTATFKTLEEIIDPDAIPLLLKDTFNDDRTEAPDAHAYAPFTVNGPLKMWDVSSAGSATKPKEKLGKAMRGSKDVYGDPFSYGYEFEKAISDFEITAWCGMNANGKDDNFTGSFTLSSDAAGANAVKLEKGTHYQSKIVKEFDDFKDDGAMLEVEITLTDEGKRAIAESNEGLRYWKYETNRSRHWAGIFREVRIYGFPKVIDALMRYNFDQALASGDTADRVEHDLSFPAELDGYRVTWQSDNEALIGSDGKHHTENLTNSYYGGKVTFTASIYKEAGDTEPAATRQYTVQMYKNTEGWTGEDFINYDLTQFTDPNQFTAPQPANALATDVKTALPTGVEGGSSFSWSIKEDTEYARIEKGKLYITQKVGEDVPLTLVLTATKDGASLTREYPINIIKSYGESISGVTISSSSGSGKGNVDDPGFEKYWESAEGDTECYLQYKLEGVYPFMTVVLGEIGDNVQSYRLMTSEDGSKWTTVYSGQTLGNMKQVTIPLVQLKPKYFRAEFTPKAGSTVKIAQFLLLDVALNDDQIFDSSFNLIDLPRSTSTDLELVTEGVFGATISWQSSNPSVISESGKVTRTKNTQSATLTATVTYNGKPVSREYPPITVLPKSSGGGTGGGGGGSNGGGSGSGSGLPYIPGNDTPVQPNENEKPAGIYKDVADSHWAYDYIKALTEQKVISGGGDGYFYPENSVTREEFLKMLLSAANIPVTNEAVSFEDVDAGAWYAPYVSTAYRMGIVKGIDDTRFGIGENIQRQDMAVMADRVLKLMGKETEGAALSYNDKAEIADYAVSAVENLTALEIMNGDENQNFLPRTSATRAESAKIVCVLSELAE